MASACWSSALIMRDQFLFPDEATTQSVMAPPSIVTMAPVRHGYTCNTASESWKYLREAIQKSAPKTPKKKTSKNCDWFDAKSVVLTPVIEIKRAALSEYKRSLSEKTRSARRKVQHTSRRCANEYWQELSHDIQNAAATGNIRGKYEGMKKALRLMQSKTAPPKTSSRKVITDKAKQMERWVEHYSELYSRENIVVTSALDTIDLLPIMEELDAEPTQEELNKAITT
ncbi:hypothetical protein SRHO_G00019730 [Serrasalmus rhombeus]